MVREAGMETPPLAGHLPRFPVGGGLALPGDMELATPDLAHGGVFRCCKQASGPRARYILSSASVSPSEKNKTQQNELICVEHLESGLQRVACVDRALGGAVGYTLGIGWG